MYVKLIIISRDCIFQNNCCSNPMIIFHSVWASDRRMCQDNLCNKMFPGSSALFSLFFSSSHLVVWMPSPRLCLCRFPKKYTWWKCIKYSVITKWLCYRLQASSSKTYQNENLCFFYNCRLTNDNRRICIKLATNITLNDNMIIHHSSAIILIVFTTMVVVNCIFYDFIRVNFQQLSFNGWMMKKKTKKQMTKMIQKREELLPFELETGTSTQLSRCWKKKKPKMKWHYNWKKNSDKRATSSTDCCWHKVIKKSYEIHMDSTAYHFVCQFKADLVKRKSTKKKKHSRIFESILKWTFAYHFGPSTPFPFNCN